MSLKEVEFVPDEGDLRVLDVRGILAHYSHVQDEERRRFKGCRYCASPSASFVVAVEAPWMEGQVDKGRGVDATGPSASPPSPGEDGEEVELSDDERKIRGLVRKELFG